MAEQLIAGLGLIVRLLEIIGAGVLVLGFVIATTIWILQSRQLGPGPAAEAYRRSLGRAVLIGLEVLVAATIIKTVMFELSIENLARLAAMIAIRTIIGWTTFLEVYGRWPWQPSRSGAAP